jgi:Spy/CpxP family protein refolding chaperone
MSHSIRPTSLALSLTRSVAIAALMSAPLAAVPFFAAHAQTAPTAKPIAANPADERAETVEQRITKLHQDLKITPEQETKWNDVAQAMRDNAANMEKLVAEKRRQAPQNMTAIDDLDTYQKFAQAHVDGLKNLTSAFKSLYGAMSDQQKKNADQVFESFGRTPNSGHG